ncbi:KPN_02809 family neutral zinc metallopeptidase [Desulfuromonas acetexigens]|uniref:Flagellar biosynthesis protein FlgM n=1 Tax=Trichloromonas acetexigens TaxID=38815 RepID=A0A550J7A3_9BACT|nr:neutral zinc metallopeptidase [Desulfuromonas acetexigens]TRO79108.1 flagellar biosynthesis protein FlgM [Desulfuromonas acetexigens]
MRWQDGRRSDNVEDRRGMRSAGGKKVGGGIGVIILALIAMYFGVDPAIVLDQGGAPGMSGGDSAVSAPRSPEEDVLAEFVSVVLADTEDVWNDLFRQMGREYREPRLVLFTDAVESACGYAQAAVGPFYCPSDQSVYIDLGFYRDLKLRHQAPGDFAQAYVIAHEVGHHVQKLLGILDKVNNLRRRVSEVEANQLLVRMELQADCMAGLWANHAHRERQVLEEGDIEEALNAASAIGDDRLQRQSRGYVSPDSFTHGTSAQRVEWFTRGARSGDLNQCDTFAAGRL